MSAGKGRFSGGRMKEALRKISAGQRPVRAKKVMPFSRFQGSGCWHCFAYAFSQPKNTLTKENIRNIYQELLQKTDLRADAGTSIAEFFEAEDFEEVVLNTGFAQRIILINANFLTIRSD